MRVLKPLFFFPYLTFQLIPHITSDFFKGRQFIDQLSAFKNLFLQRFKGTVRKTPVFPVMLRVHIADRMARIDFLTFNGQIIRDCFSFFIIDPVNLFQARIRNFLYRFGNLDLGCKISVFFDR